MPPRDASAEAARASGQAFIGAAKLQTPGEPRLLRGCSAPGTGHGPSSPACRAGALGRGPPPKTLTEIFPFDPWDIQGGSVSIRGENSSFGDDRDGKKNNSPGREWGMSESGGQGHGSEGSILIT